MKEERALCCWTGPFCISLRKPKAELCSCRCWKQFSIDETAMSNVAHYKLTLKLLSRSSMSDS